MASTNTDVFTGVLELVACLCKLAKEPYDDTRAQNILCLCTAIEVSLKQFQPNDVTPLSQPLISALHDIMDLTRRTDRYGGFDCLHGALTIYEAMTRKQPHLLSRAVLESLGACVTVYMESWPKNMVETQRLQTRITSLHKLLDIY